MGKIKKKGESGEATNYITRTQAVRKLQLSLADFRRLCILKGIYPREPKKKKRVSGGSTASRTYYFVKDIQYLAHEPILDKFREMKAFMHKIKRAQAKKQDGVLNRLVENAPELRVDHIVRERYPTFVDALRDLDDCLCMIFLFASFPQTNDIQADVVHRCRRLADEFMMYVSKARCLTKVFLSIKGIYYQAQIQGQPVTWIVPYRFSTAAVPLDVDFRVMSTFLLFYTTLQSFVNYKLFSDASYTYPPKMDVSDRDACLLDYKLQSTQDVELASAEESKQGKVTKSVKKQQRLTQARVASALAAAVSAGDDQASNDAAKQDTADASEQAESAEDDNKDVEDIDAFPQQISGGDEDVQGSSTLYEQERERSKFTRLFEGLKFFLSREVPHESLAFVITAFGGSVSWQLPTGELAGGFSESDGSITHQIVDRPKLASTVDGRRYVQPQWIYDCINIRKLLPTTEYVMGTVLPPHLSPFVEEGENDYMPPERAEQLGAQPQVNTEEGEEDEAADEEQSDDEVYEKELAEELGREDAEAESESRSGASEPSKKRRKKKTEKDIRVFDEASEEKELAKMMMSKKKRNLYNKMMYGKAQKKAQADKLRQKRKAIDEAKGKTKQAKVKA